MDYSYKDSSDNTVKDSMAKDNQNKDQKDHEDTIKESGQVVLDSSRKHSNIQLVTIIGEIEGHDNLPASSKTTKYEHLLPKLVEIEDDANIKGVLFLLNTVGGDVSAGLALAELIASMSKPTVSLILGDSHSIGVPLAVSTDYSFIVPTATMIVHPVRMSGTVLGVQQTYDYFERISDRIVSFIAAHSGTTKEELEQMMVNTKMLTKDLGTILVGKQAVESGLVNEVGGISDAFRKLDELMKGN